MSDATTTVRARWIKFEDAGASPSGKTRCWLVLTNRGGWLGDVKWFGRWRRYAFFPAPETVFERTCLRDIANFCDAQTKARNEAPNA